MSFWNYISEFFLCIDQDSGGIESYDRPSKYFEEEYGSKRQYLFVSGYNNV